MGKRATISHIAGIELQRESEVPLHRQIDAALRRGILEGRFAGGARIPSSRALAEQLGVSRLTVMDAFEQLIAEGYLESRIGSGTRVARVRPVEAFDGQRSRGRAHRSAPQPDIALSKRGTTIARFEPRRLAQRGAPRPFRLGAPALDAFPYAEWVRVAAASRRRMRPEMLGYNDPAGYMPLRRAIAEYLGPARAVQCRAENVIIVSGAQQAFGLALRLLTDPGDPVWMEDPGFPAIRGAALASGACVTPVAVDAEGLRVADDARTRTPRLIFVTPSHQFPLGVSMSLSRRLALLDYARRVGTVVVEDDYGCEYSYTGRPLSALQGLDAYGCVIYVGSFGKVLFPALRLGYMVVPTWLVDAFTAAKGLLDCHAPLLEQATVADFIRDGHFVRHIARMRRLYRERQTALVESIRRFGQGVLDARPAATGMHLVASLPPSVDDRAVARAAAEKGIEVAAVSAYRRADAGAPGLVLGFASTPSAQIEQGIQQLVGVVRRTLRTGGRA